MNKKLSIIGAAVVSASVISGCSDDSTPAASAAGIPTPVTVERVADLAIQTATISIADPNGTPAATVTGQPADMELTVSATSVSATELELVIGLTNNSARPLSSPKILVDTTASTLGTAVFTGSGTIGTDEYISLGHLAIDAGATNDPTLASTFAVSVIDGTDPMVIQVNIPTQDTKIFVSDNSSSNSTPEINIFDTSTAQGTVNIDVNHLAYNQYNGNAGLREGDRSRDGKYAFFGHRQVPMVAVYDLTTGEADRIDVSVDDRTGSVESVAVSPDGAYAYASLVDGAHMAPWYQGGQEGAQLVKIDIGTMTVIDRLELPTYGMDGRPHRLSMTPDGATGALAMGNSTGEVHVVDLNAMEITTTLDVSDTGLWPRYATISPDGAYVFVGHIDDEGLANQDGLLDIVTVADGTISPVTITSTGGRPKALRFDSSNRLFYVRDGGADVTIMTFTNGDYSTVTGNTEHSFSGTPDGFDFGPYGDYYYTCNGGWVTKVSMTTDTEISYSSVTGATSGHMCVVSAY